MDRRNFIRGTMLSGVLAACPAMARAAEEKAGVKPAPPRKKTPGMEALSELYRETSKVGLSKHFVGGC